MEKQGGSINMNLSADEYEVIKELTLLKTHDVLADIMTCPREIVRYFHRNNSCDCLKELYYTLKTTTTRTTHCIVCNCVKEIQQMKQCSKCKRAQYCSQECARAHHQDHKYLCKHWRALQEVDQELSFGMGYLNF
eukprot:scaffold65295_cov71-Cyclotella_meneghiniana.AAC.7